MFTALALALVLQQAPVSYYDAHNQQWIMIQAGVPVQHVYDHFNQRWVAHQNGVPVGQVVTRPQQQPPAIEWQRAQPQRQQQPAPRQPAPQGQIDWSILNPNQ